MHAKTTARANADPLVPSCKPIATASAVTPAECDDGMPPELSILLESHFFSLYLQIFDKKCWVVKQTNIQLPSTQSVKNELELKQGSIYNICSSPRNTSKSILAHKESSQNISF